MGEIANNRYKVVSLSKNYLDKNGFRYCKELSSKDDGDIYRYRFPVYRYLDFVTLECEITLNYDANVAIVDVMDTSRGRYAAFYHVDYGQYPIIDDIEKKINTQLKKLNMEVIEDDNTDRRQMFDMPTPRNKKPRRPKKSKSGVSGEKQGVQMGTESPM